MRFEGPGGIAVVAMLLGGCATAQPEPVVITKEVFKPIPVSCVPPSLAETPLYPDTDEALLAATPDRRYALVIAGRELRKARANEVEPVIIRCRQVNAN